MPKSLSDARNFSSAELASSSSPRATRAWTSSSRAGARSIRHVSGSWRRRRSISSTARSASPRSRARRARQSPASPTRPASSSSCAASEARPCRRRSSASSRSGAAAQAGRERLKSSAADLSSASASAHLPRHSWTTPVVGSTEGEHVAAAVPLGELGDSVGPFDRPHVVVHRRAGRHEDAEGPGVGDRDRRRVLECDRGRLVETAHSLVHLTGRDQRRTVERETEHLEVLDLETAPETRPRWRLARALARCHPPRVRSTPGGTRASRDRARAREARASARRARATRLPPRWRRETRPDRPPATWPCGPHRPRRRVPGTGEMHALARRIRPPRRRATMPAQLSPSHASGVSSTASTFERLPRSRPSCVRQRRPAGPDRIGGDVPGGPRHTGHCRARLR